VSCGGTTFCPSIRGVQFIDDHAEPLDVLRQMHSVVLILEFFIVQPGLVRPDPVLQVLCKLRAVLSLLPFFLFD
jgi:hypothetical protein